MTVAREKFLPGKDVTESSYHVELEESVRKHLILDVVPQDS